MSKDPSSYRPATRLVQGGVMRSPHGETSEALYLTSGYVYDDAEQAEATFAGTVEHYQYSRFANPTLTMLEQRLCLIEGADEVAHVAGSLDEAKFTVVYHRAGRVTGVLGVASPRNVMRCRELVATGAPLAEATALFA